MLTPDFILGAGMRLVFAFININTNVNFIFDEAIFTIAQIAAFSILARGLVTTSVVCQTAFVDVTTSAVYVPNKPQSAIGVNWTMTNHIFRSSNSNYQPLGYRSTI